MEEATKPNDVDKKEDSRGQSKPERERKPQNRPRQRNDSDRRVAPGPKSREVNLGEEKDLGSKTLRFQNKRFYLDVKQNIQGKFIKIVEVRPGNYKTRIVMSMSSASELRDKLVALTEFFSQLPPHNPDTVANSTQGPTLAGGRREAPQGRFIEVRLRSDTITRDDKRYYLDLKENLRGRFLRITMMTQNMRSQVVVPGNGMISMRDALEEIIAEFASNEMNGDAEKEVQQLMESHTIRSERRTFYFDVGSNRRGMFLRISEVQPTFRASITIPDSSWSQFRDHLGQYVVKLDAVKQEFSKKASPIKETSSGVNGVSTGKEESKPPKKSNDASSSAKEKSPPGGQKASSPPKNKEAGHAESVVAAAN